MKIIPTIKTEAAAIWADVRPLLAEHVGYVALAAVAAAAMALLIWAVR